MIYLYVQAQNQKKYNKTLNIEKIDVGCSLEWLYGLNTSVPDLIISLNGMPIT